MERVFFFIALPASLIMLIQTVMLFFGVGDEGAGVGTDTEISGVDESGDGGLGDDTGESGNVGLRFITTRGIIAFLTVAGWAGFISMQAGLHAGLASLIAFACGFGAMVGVAYLVRALLSLALVHKMDYRTALGCVGEVYLTIPAAGEGGRGKIHVTVNGTFREVDAITEYPQAIKSGTKIRVTDIVGDGVMVAEPFDVEMHNVINLKN